MEPKALSKLLLAVGLALTLGILLIALPAIVSAQGPGSGWMQVNADGFGDWRNQAILALAPFVEGKGIRKWHHWWLGCTYTAGARGAVRS